MRIESERRVKARPVRRRALTVRVILEQVQAFSFTIPSLVLLVIFLVYPIGYVVYISFQRWNLLGIPQYVGLDNYTTILFRDTGFLQSVWNTVIFVVLAVPAQVVLGLLLAVLLNSALPGRGVFRTIFFIPMAVSFVAAGIVFERMFTTGSNLGIIPQFLANHGIGFPDWEHRDGFWAMIIIVIMNTWKSAGYAMIVYLAGLQSISPDYYEAAQVDGIRNGWQRFRYISWPLLGPTTALLLITTTIFSFRAFDPFFVMTNGGPVGATTTVVLYIYNNYAGRTGVASAASTLMLIGVLMITAVQFLATRQRESYF